MTETDYLEWRTRGIGASDIAGILNISPWTSPYSVWASKTMFTGGVGTWSNSEAMQWGKLLEDAIIDEAARRLEITAYGRQTRCEHKAFEWARATVDAFCRDERFADDAGLGVIEAKTTSEPYWTDLPAYYEAQVLWQLEVTNRSYGWLAALHSGRKLSLWRIEAQPELQRAMLETAQTFWNAFVIPRVAPVIDGSVGTSETLNALYRDSHEGERVDLDEYETVFARLAQLKYDITALDDDKARLENEIKHAMGTAEIGVINGREVCTWKSVRSRRTDLDLLRTKHPDIAAECETVTESRRFLIKRLAKSESGA